MPKETPETDKILNQLREWCQQKRGRQQEVADIIGTTRGTVSDWFHDRKEPTAEQILKVLKLLRQKRRAEKSPKTTKTPHT